MSGFLETLELKGFGTRETEILRSNTNFSQYC